MDFSKLTDKSAPSSFKRKSVTQKWQRHALEDFSATLLFDLITCFLARVQYDLPVLDLWLAWSLLFFHNSSGPQSLNATLYCHVMLSLREHCGSKRENCAQMYKSGTNTDFLSIRISGWRFRRAVWEQKDKNTPPISISLPCSVARCGRDWQDERWRLLSPSALLIGWKVEVTLGALPIINSKHKLQYYFRYSLLLCTMKYVFHRLKYDAHKAFNGHGSLSTRLTRSHFRCGHI